MRRNGKEATNEDTALGESFLRKQAESFVRQMDKAHQTHIQTPNLFTEKDESIRREFTLSCGTAIGAQEKSACRAPAPGDAVIVCAPPGEAPFVLHGNRRLSGFAPADQAYFQRLADEHAELGGMIHMQVTSITALGDVTITPTLDSP